MEIMEMAVTLAASGVGIALALWICRLFAWVRRSIPELATFYGSGIVILAGFFSLFCFSLFPVYLGLILLCAGIVWCQRSRLGELSLTWGQLFTILTAELLVTGFAVFLLYAVLPHPLNRTALPTHAAVALLAVVFLQETLGPVRWRLRG